MSGLIDFSQRSLYVSAASILFNPTFWNIAARSEYHHKVLTKLAGGNPRFGCYGLAVVIFSLGLIRDGLYASALDDQPKWSLLTSNASLINLIAYGLLAAGNTLVVTSMYALGVTGTYLGDYFGILMEKKVTGFPFSICDAPMYIGSTLSFIGTALLYKRPAGLALSMLVALCYKVALTYEDPFTGEIYAKRDRERSQKTTGKKGQ